LAPGEVSESALGPRSYPRCQTCLEEQAESIAVICLRIYLEGGPETLKDSYQGNWWPFGVKSYSNGEYISWPRILALYPRFEALFEPY
jgi:hypothetical protein